MKTLDYIPTSKIQRATKLVQTGAKVGVNYLQYYGDSGRVDNLTSGFWYTNIFNTSMDFAG